MRTQFQIPKRNLRFIQTTPLSTAFDRGYEAYGKYAINPFAPNTVEFEQWEKGFLDAMDDEVYDIEDENDPGLFVQWDDDTGQIITYH